jgi:DNA helicase-4
MLKEMDFLPANTLGKLLGYKGIKLDRTTLVVHMRSVQAALDLSQCSEFAQLNERWYGSQLTLKLNNTSQSIRFLKTQDAKDFVHTLNRQIAITFAEYLSSLVTTWESAVVTQYPRQSYLSELQQICSTISKGYKSDPATWNQFLSDTLIKQVKEITQFHPVSYAALQQHHETAHLEKRELFLDRVESNKLTPEQRLGVLRSDDFNMVLAAAGTGKTSVMVAKALDLIDRGLAKPEEILILAYNKAAANELKTRLERSSNKTGITLEKTPHISTFHSLGRQVLRDARISTYMSIFVEDPLKLKQWVTEWLLNYLSEDISRLVDFISLTPEPVDPFTIKTQAEYEAYVRDNELRTLNDELVKGYQELVIANFMYLNGIPYTYEARYVSKRRIEVGFDYSPDFHLDGTDIYIEHFGINREGHTRPDIDAHQYNEEMKSKRALHIECRTTLVETFHYEWVEETLTSGLGKKLKHLGVEFNPINSEQLLEQLQSTGKIANWSDLLLKALASIRVERLDYDSMLVRFQRANISQPQKYTVLLNALHEAYVQELKEQDTIDFDDMIIRSIEAIGKGLFTPKWTYVLVDEFQDISTARMDLVKAIIERGPTPSLTVVGDDWQSIYRFSGGKLELTTRFDELVGPYTETKLQKTFRYNNSIADTAGLFIMENPEQYKKYIVTHTKVDSSQVYLLDDKVGVKDGLYQRVVEVVSKIKSEDNNASIAVIGRYNYLLNESKAALAQNQLVENVSLWSFHKSKGLEADYCILIGFSQGKLGFPNENIDQAVIEALLPALDAYPHSEERRLLYVGLTRAKKKSYIIGDPTSPSAFITELLAPKYDVNIHSKAFQERYRKIFKCPNCEAGYLKLINGKFGGFYACSTGKGCRVGKARVCTECGAPSVDNRDSSDCNNQDCRHSMKICEQCGRPMKLRNGKYGDFWGCSGYGIQDDQCRNTKKQ